MPIVICAGLITVDFVYELPEFPTEGTKNIATASKIVAGGGALNAAATIASLGGTAILAGAVGDDDQGRFLREEFVRYSIDGSLVETVAGATTARSSVLITKGGERTIVNYREAPLFGHNPRPPRGLRYDAVLTDTRWAAGSEALLGMAKRDEKPAILDAEAPLSVARKSLELATHVVFSEQGLRDFGSDPTENSVLNAARQLRAWVAVTRGGDPVPYSDGSDLTHAPVYAVQVADTLGAGDVWHGAFAMALGTGTPEPDAVIFANAAAAVMISRQGVRKFPTEAEANAMMAT